MAGTAVNLSVSDYRFNDAKYVTVPGMEEDVVLNHLSDQSFNKRAEILEGLRATARINNGRLPFSDKSAIFNGLALSLSDSNWDVRHKCVQLISDLIPQLGIELDDYMSIVLPKLVPNIGHSKITIRRAVIQTLHVYMKHAKDVSRVFKAIVKHGLEGDEQKIRKETIIALPMLFTPEFANENFFDIVQSLAKKLLDNSAEDNLQSIALVALDKIRGIATDTVFSDYIQRLSPALRKFYLQLTNKLPDKSDSTLSEYNNNSRKKDDTSSGTSVPENYYGSPTGRASQPRQSNGKLEFGIIPSHIMAQLHDQEDFRTRSQGVEELRRIVEDIEDSSQLIPHMIPFISFINNLLDDSNFKITTVTLDILDLLVDKLSGQSKSYVKPLISALTKRMGDNKIVVRQAIMKVAMRLMQTVSVTKTLEVLCENLNHRNSRVRQETINIVIASLLRFPSYDFDQATLCQTIAFSLVDPKRPVRHACFECLAVLAQAMGPGRLQPLVQAVDAVELSQGGDGVMQAVQARLARRQLAKLNPSGLVEYAITLSMGSQRTSAIIPQGADIEWIMAVSGTAGGSARSIRSDTMELESVTSSARSTPLDNLGTPSRRFYSAGRGKNRLPWEDEEDLNDSFNELSQSRRPRNNEPGGQLRTTGWGENNVEGNNWGGDSPESAGTMSYKQIHLNKIRRQQAEERRSLSSNYPGRVNNTNADDTASPKSATGNEARTVSKRMSVSNDFDFSPDSSLNLGYSYVPSPDTSLRDSAVFSKSTDSPSRRYSRSYSNEPSSLNTSINGSFAGGERSLLKRQSLSSSWPDAKKLDEPGLSHKPVLGPISAQETGNGDWSEAPTDRRSTKEPAESPIHLKPTIARSASRRNKVPPIPKASEALSSPREDDKDSAYGPSLESTGEFNEQQDDILSSLKKIRHSASKKKAEKLFDKVEKKERRQKQSRTPSPDDSLNESGIFSPSSTLNSSRNPDGSDKKKTAKKAESPFGKPRLARHASTKDKILIDLNSTFEDKKERSPLLFNSRTPKKPEKLVQVDSSKLDFNPDAGVTFRENKNSDVKVVGKGYSEDSSFSDPKPSVASKARERRRLTKGSLLSPLGMAALNSHGQLELDDDKVPEQESIGVVGRGMFDSPVDQTGDKKSQSTVESDEEEIALSGTMKQRMASKIRQQKEEAEQRRLEKAREKEQEKERQQKIREEKERERERQQKIREEKTRKREEEMQKERDRERERAQERLRNLQANETPSSEDLSVSGSNTSYAANHKPQVVTPTSKKSHSPSDPVKPLSAASRTNSQDILQPLNNPEQGLRDALANIAQDDWQQKNDGLTTVRRLLAYNPEVLLRDLHTVTLAVMNEVKNLRSQVSRLAIITMSHMFEVLRKSMDADLDSVAKVLLHKCGESNSFIRDDVEKSLRMMVENVTPQRALVALVQGGVSHRNQVVRRCSSFHLVTLVEKMGEGRILSGVKDITDRVLPAMATLLNDGSPEARYNGRKILFMLMQHPDFEKIMTKHLAANMVRNVKDAMETLRTKGLGEMPTDRPSARARRSGQGTRGSVAGSTNGDTFPPSAPSSGKRTIRLDENKQEMLKSLTNKMVSNEWKERLDAVGEFKELCECNASLVATSIVKLFDKFCTCLRDPNSKVNIFALNVMLDIMPILRDHLPNVVNIVVPAVAYNLSSKNKEIYTPAMEILDGFLEHLDGSCLLQPFANVTQAGNARIKPDMVEKLAYLVSRVYPRKQKQVHIHILPLLWHLLSSVTGSGAVQGGTGNIRTATAKLVEALYNHMGAQLTDIAGQNSSVSPRTLQQLQDIIKSFS